MSVIHFLEKSVILTSVFISPIQELLHTHTQITTAVLTALFTLSLPISAFSTDPLANTFECKQQKQKFTIQFLFP